MLYPMFGMVVLTVIVAILTVRARFRAVSKGDIKAGYFRTMQGGEMPEAVAKTTRNFNNMFELPVLFYAGAGLYVALGIDSPAGIYLAWGFLLLRVLHSIIHLTYNHVLHRLLCYAAGLACLLGLWINLLILAG